MAVLSTWQSDLTVGFPCSWQFPVLSCSTATSRTPDVHVECSLQKNLSRHSDTTLKLTTIVTPSLPKWSCYTVGSDNIANYTVSCGSLQTRQPLSIRRCDSKTPKQGANQLCLASAFGTPLQACSATFGPIPGLRV